MTNNILIVDDQPEIAELLKLYLEKEGFSIFEAYDGSEALKIISMEKIDLLLVDLMMPIIDGYQLIKKVREELELPIIIISAKGEDHEKILGLGLGADDFVQKPFNPLEVVARVQSLLRRSYQYKSLQKEPNNIIKPRKKIVGELVLDEDTFTISHSNTVISLTKIEFNILDLLMDKPGRVFTKQQIFEKAWNEYYMGGEEDNTINVHISKIRDKIEKNPKKPMYIKTVRGLGYKFERNTNN
ncbi:DNA-binding response OmpR family regulator [Metabacillus crassostreae]|uniref:response regulator n=1 Tax=Metabacillus crassostreae TaxID=929098 RepID=UPI001959E1BE|nr:DNA-binding response OmpR family regulator [Metabacillus crassostreae]